jgi:hypothetical protein
MSLHLTFYCSSDDQLSYYPDISDLRKLRRMLWNWSNNSVRGRYGMFNQRYPVCQWGYLYLVCIKNLYYGLATYYSWYSGTTSTCFTMTAYTGSVTEGSSVLNFACGTDWSAFTVFQELATTTSSSSSGTYSYSKKDQLSSMLIYNQVSQLRQVPQVPRVA